MNQLKLIPICVALIGLISCKSGYLKSSPTPEAGLVKVAILYPGGEGKTFGGFVIASKGVMCF